MAFKTGDRARLCWAKGCVGVLGEPSGPRAWHIRYDSGHVGLALTTSLELVAQTVTPEGRLVDAA